MCRCPKPVTSGIERFEVRDADGHVVAVYGTLPDAQAAQQPGQRTVAVKAAA